MYIQVHQLSEGPDLIIAFVLTAAHPHDCGEHEDPSAVGGFGLQPPQLPEDFDHSKLCSGCRIHL